MNLVKAYVVALIEKIVSPSFKRSCTAGVGK
jgi:hypothetical protein